MGYKIFKEEQKRKVLGVLFDMDGLLLDTERLYVENFMIASKEAGFPMSFKETLGLRSLNIEERQRYLEAIKGPKIKDEPIRLRMDYLTDKAIKDHGAKPKLGAKELLDYLEEHNIPCAIVSSSAKERIINNLKPNGFLNKFQALCSGNEVEKGKPYPDIYLLVLKK